MIEWFFIYCNFQNKPLLNCLSDRGVEKIIFGGSKCTGVIMIWHFVQFQDTFMKKHIQKKYCSRARSTSKNYFFHISAIRSWSSASCCSLPGHRRRQGTFVNSSIEFVRVVKNFWNCSDIFDAFNGRFYNGSLSARLCPECLQ